MAVMIKGMEMPRTCDDCLIESLDIDLTRDTRFYCPLTDGTTDGVRETSRLEDCPLSAEMGAQDG